MKSNDISNRMRLRFKQTKDFDKLIQQLEKEDYKIYIKGYTKRLTNEKQKEQYGFNIDLGVMFEIIVLKDNNKIVNVLFENNRDAESEYKQNIFAIYY